MPPFGWVWHSSCFLSSPICSQFWSCSGLPLVIDFQTRKEHCDPLHFLVHRVRLQSSSFSPSSSSSHPKGLSPGSPFHELQPGAQDLRAIQVWPGHPSINWAKSERVDYKCAAPQDLMCHVAIPREGSRAHPGKRGGDTLSSPVSKLLRWHTYT